MYLFVFLHWCIGLFLIFLFDCFSHSFIHFPPTHLFIGWIVYLLVCLFSHSFVFSYLFPDSFMCCFARLTWKMPHSNVVAAATFTRSTSRASVSMTTDPFVPLVRKRSSGANRSETLPIIMLITAKVPTKHWGCTNHTVRNYYCRLCISNMYDNYGWEYCMY